MTSRIRRLARFFSCLLMFGIAAYGAEPAKTVVSDTMYRADGSPASGTMVISWPAFVTADGKPVAAGSKTVKIGANGAVNIPLVPTQGATPAGTYYKVVLSLDDGASSQEYWAVPTLSPTSIAAIRSSVVPATVAMQVVSREYVDGAVANTVRKTGDESIAGTKSFISSPLVPSPSAPTAAANKDYVDVSVAAAVPGAGTLALNKGGSGQTSWTPARCVRVANNGFSLESAPADCGIASNADMVDGQHAASFQAAMANAATLSKIAESGGNPLWNGSAWPGGGGSGNATQIQGKAVDTPTAAGQQLTYDGTKFAKQDKPIDLRDWVDCTGTADASTVLNAKTDGTQAGNWCGADVNFNGCQVRLAHIWKIQYCGKSPRLHLGPKQGGGKILGCVQDSAPTGLPNVPLVMFSRTGTPNLEGGSSEAWASDAPGGCTSNATVNVTVENDTTTNPGGVTTTQGYFREHNFQPRTSGAITNWIGLQIGGSTIMKQNLEGMLIEENNFNGQFSQGSYSVVIGSGNSDHGVMRHNSFGYTNYAVQTIASQWIVESNAYGTIGDAATYTVPGCVWQMGNGANNIQFKNEEPAEGTGQFICPIPATQGPSYITFIGGRLGGEDAGTMVAGAPNIDCGQCGGDWTFMGGVRGKNIVGGPIINYTVNNGDGMKFHDLGNNWLSTPVFTLDTTKGARQDDWHVINLMTGLTLQGSKANGVGNSPPLDFETTHLSGDAVNRYRMAAMGGRSVSGGNTGIAIAQTIGNGGIFSVGMPLGGGLVVNAAAAIAAPPVAATGGTGSTTWGYKVVLYANGGLVTTTAETQITNGVATLSSSTYNKISLRVSGEYWKACPYRITAGGTPSTTGLLSTAGPDGNGCVILLKNPLANAPGWSYEGAEDLNFYDTGFVADGSTPPATTADGRVVAAGPVIAPYLLLTPSVLTRWSRTGWSVTASSSYSGYAASNVLDGNTSTSWADNSSLPATLDIDMGYAQTLGGLTLTPDVVCCHPKDYEIYLSSDGTTWGSAVASGTWADNNNDKAAYYPPQKVRYARLRILTKWSGGTAHVAELYLHSSSPVDADTVNGKHASDFLAATTQLPLTRTAVLHKWLASYDATTGAYSQTQPDYSDLTGTPTLATVAATGAYADLTGKPTLAANTTATSHQFFSAYNSTTGAFTKAQPDYSDLTGAPTLAATKTCAGTDKVSAYDASTGGFTCSADQTGSGGSSITSLNGATVTTQTFVDGANIHVATNTGTGAHTIAVTGLGDAAAKNTGTTAGTVAAGDDSRFTNARTPTAHASTHQNGGGDEIATATAGANAIPKAGAGGTLGTAWIPDLSATYLPLHSTADLAAGLSAQYTDWNSSSSGASIKNKPTLGTAAAKNIPASGDASATEVVYGTDTRLSNARTPSAHASSHQNGGGDEIATATAGANAIPKAGSGGQLAAGWMPAFTGDVTTSAGAVATALRTGLNVKICEIHVWGTGTSSVLQDTDDEVASCLNKYGVTWTITYVGCRANAGSPTVMITKTGGNNVLSGNLPCGTASWASGSLTGTSADKQTADGGTVDVNIVSAGGTATNIRVVIAGTI